MPLYEYNEKDFFGNHRSANLKRSGATITAFNTRLSKICSKYWQGEHAAAVFQNLMHYLDMSLGWGAYQEIISADAEDLEDWVVDNKQWFDAAVDADKDPNADMLIAVDGMMINKNAKFKTRRRY